LNCVCAKFICMCNFLICICNFVIYVCDVYFCKAYGSVMITNSQPYVRAIIVFMCVKKICACNKLHYGKVLLAVMTSPSYFVTACLIGYLNMTHFIHHSTRGTLTCFWHLLLAWLAMASYARIACGDNSAPVRLPRVEWCMKCVIFRYPIREAVTKYDGDVITVTVITVLDGNYTFPDKCVQCSHGEGEIPFASMVA
jgi:hypothetical protein